jgi:SAM-dependent methyltransferase
MMKSMSRARVALVAMWILCAAALGFPNVAAQQKPPGSPRLYPPQELGLLEAPDRDLWQRPDQIMDAIGVADASVVADVGAGSGWFTIRLARRVGPRGIVYAQDVQLEMLNAITRRVQREGLQNVKPILGRGSDPRLPARSLDAVLVVDAYHEIEDRVTMLANIARALKPQGRIGVVDFKLDGTGPGPSPEERVSPDVVVKDAERAGLRLIRQESFLPYQYFLIFGARPGTASAAPPQRSVPTNFQRLGSTTPANITLMMSTPMNGYSPAARAADQPPALASHRTPPAKTTERPAVIARSDVP